MRSEEGGGGNEGRERESSERGEEERGEGGGGNEGRERGSE